MKRIRYAAAAALAAFGVTAIAESRLPSARAAPGFFTGADSNRDGALSLDEMAAAVRQRFLALDGNHDGRVTPDELHRRSGAADKGWHGPMDGPAGRGRMLERLDTNHDGKISRDEFLAPALAHFGRIDANHDGVIDQAEIETARQKMMSLHGDRAMDGDEPPPPPPPGNDH